MKNTKIYWAILQEDQHVKTLLQAFDILNATVLVAPGML